MPLGSEICSKFTTIDPITKNKNITKNVFMSEQIMKEIRRWWTCIEKLKEEIDKYVKVGEDLKKIEELISKSEDLLGQFLK